MKSKSENRIVAVAVAVTLVLGGWWSARIAENGSFKTGQEVAASAPYYSIGYQCDPQTNPPFLSGRTGFWADLSSPSHARFQNTATTNVDLVEVSPAPATKGQFPAYTGSSGLYQGVPPGTDGTAVVWDSTQTTGINSATVLTPTSTNTVTNKTMSGASNTFSNIPVSAITGGAVINGTLWWSPVQNALVATVGTNASTQTNGVMFLAMQPMTITGLNVVYPDNTSRSVKFSLWRCTDGSNCVGVNSTRVATTTQTVTTVGFHTYAFTSPYSLGSGDTYRRFMLAYSVVGGGVYWRFNNSNAAPGGAILQSASTSPATCAMPGGPSLCWVGIGCWVGTEDTPPTNGPNTEYNPIEPVFTVP